MTLPSFEFLEWDSEFFGFRIGRMTAGSGGADELPLMAAWCREHRIDCMYLLADADAGYIAAEGGFLLTDIRVRLEVPVLSPAKKAECRDVRPFQPADLPAISEIAAASHHDSRFYYDPRFPRAKCDELYRTWIRRSAEGWANAVFVAEAEGQPVGYISCHLSGTDGSIGLIAVDANARGRGVGRQLVQTALDYFRDQEMRRALVVTQARNLASQRLYQTCGFITESVQLWFHHWPGSGEAEAARTDR